MVFDAREVESKLDELAPFPFIGTDGTERTLPNPMSLPTELFRDLTEAYNTGADADVFKMLEDLVEPDVFDAVCAMRIGATSQLLMEWLGGLGDPGKSLPPPSGPNRAARRSKPTARSGASTSGKRRPAKSPAA